MLVDSIEAWTPVPAVASPTRAGQLSAQGPLPAALSPWSLVKTYRVRPSPSTRMSPSLLLGTATVVPPVSWAAGGGHSAGAAAPPRPPRGRRLRRGGAGRLVPAAAAGRDDRERGEQCRAGQCLPHVRGLLSVGDPTPGPGNPPAQLENPPPRSEE